MILHAQVLEKMGSVEGITPRGNRVPSLQDFQLLLERDETE